MNVDEASAMHKSEHNGKTYYFCMAHCKTSFDANPEMFLKESHDSSGGHMDHH
jgi:Cu+-exporting ATPase